MPRRPTPERQSTTTGSTRSTDSTTPDNVGDDAGADLDARERGQSPQRKASGPGGNVRPAAAAVDEADDEGDEAGDDCETETYKMSWGVQPCAMPPVDPDPT